jgi:hypothetical protein
MIHIIITADFEIFGNGTGDVRQCLVNPTAELLAICDEYGAQLTLFFEIVEYWAFRKAEMQGKLRHLGYSPSALMAGLAQEAIRGGHDVQLHLHPQWLDSEYTDDGWRVNLDYWRLPNVPHGLGDFDDPLSLRGLLSRGKQDLERMLGPVCSSYECIALRAGGCCIQPAQDVIQAMKEVGLLADSSVFRGGYTQETPFDVDFRSTYSASSPWWADPKDITQAAANRSETILEMPICAFEQRRIEKLTRKRILQELQRKTVQLPPGCRGHPAVSHQQAISKTPVGFFKYLFEPVYTQWDYCSLTGDEMWRFLRRFLEQKRGSDVYSPLVMIGHPKTFANSGNLRRFLDRVTGSSWFRNGDVDFSTMRNAVRRAIEAKA